MTITFLVQKRIRHDGRWLDWQTLVSTPNSLCASADLIYYYEAFKGSEDLVQFRIDAEVN